MPNIPLPWIEGEKIPEEHLIDIFRQPPGVPAKFFRSSLVIGSRGAGKTTLIRYQKATHQGIALHINLAAEFACLTKQTGFGPLALATPKRPDLHELSIRNNRKVIGQLTSMRSADWSRRILDMDDLNGLNNSVAQEVAAARKYSAPVILFPFGPKSLLFLTALLLTEEYPDASWFVYPIPTSYDVDHSEGTERTVWLIPDLG